MIRALAIVAAFAALSGCGLDVLEGKPSSFQIEQERRAALTSAFVAPVAATSPALTAIEVVAPVPAPCFAEFRVRRCSESGEALEW